MSNIIGVRNNNTIVPYSAATKRTKQLDITSVVTSLLTNSTCQRAVIQFYADSNNIWRAVFNITFINGSQSIASDATTRITIPGVVFKTTTRQAVSVRFTSGANGISSSAVTLDSASSDIYIINTSGSTITFTTINTSGDVELNAEPTWSSLGTTAAAALEGVTAVDVYIPPANDTGAGLLSYYKEGTWTPILTRETIGTGSVSYGVRDARYTRIGNMVNFRIWCNHTITVGSGGSGSWRMSLPFTAANNSGFTVVSVACYGSDFTSGSVPFGYLADNTSYVQFYQQTRVDIWSAMPNPGSYSMISGSFFV